jgi:signal transduction histidine kinase
MEDITKELETCKREIQRLNSIIREHDFSKEKAIRQEKLIALGRFTADVAHEIRNPLTSLGGFARRLLKVLPDETKEKGYANIIVSEVQRLEKILRDVLSFSSESRLQMDYHFLNEIIIETLALYVDVLKQHSITIKQSLSALPKLWLDKNQIRQVLDNLISNAIDSMPQGGLISLETKMAFMNGVQYEALTIEDNGIGIPEDKLEKIFEPFFSSRLVGYGTGLGLSITRKIMEEHCGFIKVDSLDGIGSIFTLCFTYQPDEESKNEQCWEFMKCGVEHDANVKCPVYPHFGRSCWAVGGTFCEGKIQGTHAQKIKNCKHCNFFMKNAIKY